jgi:hypothetical protein
LRTRYSALLVAMSSCMRSRRDVVKMCGSRSGERSVSFHSFQGCLLSAYYMHNLWSGDPRCALVIPLA